MLCVVLKNRRIGRPMLVELRWKFHKVAGYGGSGKAGIFRIGKHAVKRVTKFVKHSPDIVSGKKSRLTRSGRWKIGNVTDNRQRTQQPRLFDKAIHPGTALLVVALEVVAVKERQRAAVRVKDLEYAYARRIHRKIFAFFEGQSIKLVRCVENTVLKHII